MINEILNTKQAEINLISLAYYKCDNCGFVKSSDYYIAIHHIVCCNKCGSEIVE